MNSSKLLLPNIEADEIIVEVKDKNTGTVYRRSLPIMYYENENYIAMVGEDGHGSHSETVYRKEKTIPQ